MYRTQMIEVVEELMEVLNGRKISPNDAESIAAIFRKAVSESIEEGKKLYMKTSVFTGSPPER